MMSFEVSLGSRPQDQAAWLTARSMYSEVGKINGGYPNIPDFGAYLVDMNSRFEIKTKGNIYSFGSVWDVKVGR